MRRTMMKSKIHRATVTGADVDYVGSITLDPELMRLADMREFEQVHVLDVDNGARFETYVMAGAEGDVILNGAAALLVDPGDRVIVITLRRVRRRGARRVRAADRPRRRAQPADPGRAGRAARGFQPRVDAQWIRAGPRARRGPAQPGSPRSGPAHGGGRDR